MTASVNPMPGVAWSAKAVAGDIMNRTGEESAILAVWLDPDGVLHHSKTDLTPAQYAAISLYVQTMAVTTMMYQISGDDDDDEDGPERGA